MARGRGDGTIVKAEIIATGTELLLGETLNTSVYYLTGQLSAMDIEVDYHITVGDNPERLEAVLREALGRSDLVITTGGTGQTADDLTKELVAKVFNMDMKPDPQSLEHIRQFMARRGAVMSPRDEKQANVPEGSVVLPNDLGTAPGAIVRQDGKTVVILPGPPAEMKGMFETHARPQLAKLLKLDGKKMVVRVLKVFGLEETAIEEQLAGLHSDLGITLLAKATEMHIRLVARQAAEEDADKVLDEAEGEIRRRLGSRVFARDDETMVGVVAQTLKIQGLTLATAESCTGGLLGGKLTGEPGSSAYYLGGVISYTNQVKEELLGVQRATLDAAGAVSPEVARQMAEGIRASLRSDLAVGITGIAGPDGGSPAKPVGLVYIGLATPEGCKAEKFQFIGEREGVRALAVQAALNMVRLYLVEFERGKF